MVGGDDEIQYQDSAVEKMKRDLPELCTLVYTAKCMNEISNQPDTFENTMKTMRLVVSIIASEKKELVLPSLSQRKGWPEAMSAKEEEMELAAARMDKTTAMLTKSARMLQEAETELQRASMLVQHKYDTSLRLLDELAAQASKGEYKGPPDLDRLVEDIRKDVESQVRFEIRTTERTGRVFKKRKPAAPPPLRRVPSVVNSLAGISDSDDDLPGLVSDEDSEDDDDTEEWSPGGATNNDDDASQLSYSDDSDSEWDSEDEGGPPVRRGPRHAPRRDGVVQELPPPIPEELDPSQARAFSSFFQSNNNDLIRDTAPQPPLRPPAPAFNNPRFVTGPPTPAYGAPPQYSQQPPPPPYYERQS